MLEDYLKAQKTKLELSTIYDLPVRIKGDRMLEVLGAPYSGPYNGKDADGEYFSPNTDFMLEAGDRRPAIYYHGMTPRGSASLNPEVIGKAIATRRDDEGLWFDVPLGQGKLADRVWEAAQAGNARASSGAVNYLVRKNQDGEIISWPLAELSIFDIGQGRRPANDFARVELKSLFANAGIDYPERFAKSGELEAELVEEDAGDTKKILIIHHIRK